MVDLVFYRTSDVFEAEEILQSKGIIVEIVPTPVQDKAYCGVCILIKEEDLNRAQLELNALDFQVIPVED